jgi:hypothetical protein
MSLLGSVYWIPRPASLLVNSKGGPFTKVSEAVVRLHKKCGFNVAFTYRDARRSLETWSQILRQRQKDDLAWYIGQ